MSDETTTVNDLRLLVRRFLEERDWIKFHSPKNLSMSIAIEAAELMEEFQWLTSKESLEAGRDPTHLARIRDEMADVLAYLLSLADRLQIDVSSALEQKMRANALKYPADEYRGRF